MTEITSGPCTDGTGGSLVGEAEMGAPGAADGGGVPAGGRAVPGPVGPDLPAQAVSRRSGRNREQPRRAAANIAARYTTTRTYSNAPVDAPAIRGLDCAVRLGVVYFPDRVEDFRVKVCPACGTEYGDDAAFCSRDRSPLRPAAPGHGLVGQLVGERYQVERRLGEGGMGEVYLARHILMGRSCALKVMSPRVSSDPDAVSRFNREATNASRISHPNVCAIYDFGLTQDGLVYLAMEYVEGQTLSALLDREGPLPVARAAALITQCAAGLQAAHDLGIVHRDLKPDNVMVRSGPDGETAKLVDFGIAKALVAEGGERVTQSGFVVGTPEYMAPEQLAGDPVDGRCDQYSLALVFYRSITGRLPFEGNSAQETLVKRLTDPPRPLAAAHPAASFPARLQAVMDRALARQPADRYATVTAFISAVNDVPLGDAIQTRKIETAGAAGSAGIPATRPMPATRRRSRAAAAGIALVLVGGGTWGVLQVVRGTPAAVPPLSGKSHESATTDTARLAATPPTVTAVPSSAPGTPLKQATRPVDSGTKAETADTVVPSLNTLESPTQRAWAIPLATRVLRARLAPPHKRAEAAAFLGAAALDAGKRDTALALFRLAYRLDPKPSYLKLIQQFGDTIRP
jgi:hypothetical protein